MDVVFPEIVIDPRTAGAVFEGIGALSAGASSRLLMDYPEPQRGAILDFLFKPNFGAALQHLKVEIGGDVNSTDGTEPSYARTREEFEHPRPEYFERGYEWWLMREAKRRNPDITLDILQWGAPGWIGDKDFPDAGDANALAWDDRVPRNRRRFYTQDNADFIVGFIQGAKKYHGLDIDYCGIWNEVLYDIPWIKLLRKTLDTHGLARVGIVAADQHFNWNFVDVLNRDPELKKAVQVVGTHYPGHPGPPASSSVAKECGKPLWSSEDGPWRDGPWWYGPAGRYGLGPARNYNRNYIDGRMTKTVVWALITSYYDNLLLADAGIMKANTPWSGHYKVPPSLWAIAHTTQFAQPGWIYLDSACGLLKDGGSYVCLRSPDDRGDYSLVIETIDAKTPQTLSFRVAGRLAAGPVHVWRSNPRSQFERLADIDLADNVFTIVVEPGCVYSLTTTTGQRKGEADIPPASDFALPYEDDFECRSLGQPPKYFSDQFSTFEVADRPPGGQCVRQTLRIKGIDWLTPNAYPETIMGSRTWTDYAVSVDVLIQESGFISLFGRVGIVPRDNHPPEGYWLKASHTGEWELRSRKAPEPDVATWPESIVIASGKAPFPANVWHKLKIEFAGQRIRAFIDDKRVCEVDDNASLAGMVGFGSGWNYAMFDNFSVRPVANVGDHSNLIC